MFKKEELYSTINEMSGHEIRHFVTYSKRHFKKGNSNYIKLFHAIRKGKVKSDSDIKTQFKNDAFVRNLPVAKNYLLKALTRSLFIYHSQEDLMSDLHLHLRLAQVYFDKGVFSLASTHLKKSKIIADKHELFIYQLLINELSVKNAIAWSSEENIKEWIDKEMTQEKIAFSNYLNFREYQQAYIRVKAIEKNNFMPLNDLEKKPYTDILNMQAMADPKLANSIRAKNLFFEIKTLCEDKCDDSIRDSDFNEEFLDFFLKYPKLFRKNATSLISGLHKNLKQLLHDSKFEKFQLMNEKFAKLHGSSETLNAQIKYRSLELDLLYAQKKQSDKCESIINKAKKELEMFHTSIATPLLLELFHLQSTFHFTHGEFKKALKWNLLVLKEKERFTNCRAVRKAIAANLILHFKLRNFEYLLSRMRSKELMSSFPSDQKLLKVLIAAIRQLLRGKKILATESELNKLKESGVSGEPTTSLAFFFEDPFFEQAFGQSKFSLFRIP